MVKIVICGAKGKMGAKVKENLKEFGDIVAVCGVDLKEDFSDKDYPVYSDFSKITESADAVVDFSSPKTLPKIVEFCSERNLPAVLCATGYTEEDISSIKKLSEKVAVFRSANMSIGVNVLLNAVKAAAKNLYGFDMEVIEKHHNKKVDAPSGTAIMLVNALKEVYPQSKEVYGRQGNVGARNKNEIGVHAVRGGTIVGEHQVIFAGNNEILTFTHEALSRDVFAVGAINAAKFICDKPAGIYDMNDMISGNA